MDAATRKLNMLLCEAVLFLFNETQRDEESRAAMTQILEKKLDAVEGMAIDHTTVLKWHHQALLNLTLQAKLLEMIALGVSLTHESLYFY